jgi:hypothetical protein|tara:strand:+ start:1492 stop:2547 length:1056 start_codon:yes stop_codon:yes gene_type:complete
MAYATFNKPSLQFNTKLYAGNGSTQSITGVGFQPDFIWQKERDGGSYHVITDSVRGNTKQLFPNVGAGEATDSNYITSFGSDGFGQGQNNDTNESGKNYVSWNWKAGNSAGSANSDGSISTTVSVNTTAGFSIVKWTGTGSAGTLGHGLGAVPKTIWVKKSSQSDDWFIWHEGLGAEGKLNFNNNSANQNDAGYWNNTLPTNQVFSVTSNGANNASGQTYIAYCFTNKTGFSHFGTYKGNGSSSNAAFVGGTFVYTGFKPALIMGKYRDGTGNWYMWDNKRLGYNRDNNKLMTSDAAAETTEDWIDIYSNGFKFFNNNGDFNYANYGFIFMAWAAEPLVANVGESIPATAR